MTGTARRKNWTVCWMTPPAERAIRRGRSKMTFFEVLAAYPAAAGNLRGVVNPREKPNHRTSAESDFGGGCRVIVETFG